MTPATFVWTCQKQEGWVVKLLESGHLPRSLSIKDLNDGIRKYQSQPPLELEAGQAGPILQAVGDWDYRQKFYKYNECSFFLGCINGKFSPLAMHSSSI
ncbi:hypothetical protein PG993_007331 [Apiospora rasikravindrae]|uniref:Uncharacterized protein n=1 Tax=Apiospora rasikravindrae TaxID=990691 RepID=A0ABR1SX80_9PEZI